MSEVPGFQGNKVLEEILATFFSNGYPTGELYSSIVLLSDEGQRLLVKSITYSYRKMISIDFHESDTFEIVIDILFGCVKSEVLTSLINQNEGYTISFLITIFCNEDARKNLIDYYFQFSNWGRKREPNWTTASFEILTTKMNSLYKWIILN